MLQTRENVTEPYSGPDLGLLAYIRAANFFKNTSC